MNARDYGIKNLDDLLTSIFAIKLRTGETIISYIHPVHNGMMLFLPLELEKTDVGVALRPYFPYVDDRFFYIDYDDMMFAKSSTSDYIKKRYADYCNLVHKKEIEDVIFTWQETQEENEDKERAEVFDKLEKPKEVSLH